MVAVVPAAGGVALASRRWLNPLAVFGIVAFVVLAVLVAAQVRESGVRDVDFVKGLVFAAVLGALPVAGYYGLGRWLHRRPIVLTLIVLASLLPLAYYLFVSAVVVIGLTGCPPESYECPI